LTSKAKGPGPRVACIGGISIDRKLRSIAGLRFGTSNPVSGAIAPGGVARNVAHCLARLGCSTSLHSAIGPDAPGEGLLEELRSDGVDVSGVARSDDYPTASYTAVFESDGRLSVGLADMEIFTTLDADWAARITPALESADYWFVDANLPTTTLERLLREPPPGVRILADPVSAPKAKRLLPVLRSIHALFPDRREAMALAAAGGMQAPRGVVPGRPRVDSGAREPAELAEVTVAAELIRDAGVGMSVVSLGDEGVYVDDGERPRTVAAIPPTRVTDVTGAGDALVAGYLYGLVSGSDDPLRLGLAAASLAVERKGSLAADLTTERLERRADATRAVPPPSNKR
jgi:pseudouridine kinase